MAEKEYIERESAIAEVTMMAEDRRIPVDSYCGEVVGEVIRLLRGIPAADVVPVVRGRWIRHYEQADTGEDIITYPCGWVCSECGRWESEDEPFCNCGADMMEES